MTTLSSLHAFLDNAIKDNPDCADWPVKVFMHDDYVDSIGVHLIDDCDEENLCLLIDTE